MVSYPSLRAHGSYDSELRWLDLPADSGRQTTNTLSFVFNPIRWLHEHCVVYFVCSLALGHVESLKLGKMVIRFEGSHVLCMLPAPQKQQC